VKATNLIGKLLATFAFALVVHPAGLVGGQFKRFPDTVSPDGARALAWGPVAEQKSDVASFTEVPYEDEALDQDWSDSSVNNYLIDAVAGKVIAVIPDFEFFRGPHWRKNRGSLEIGWSPDSSSALAIFNGRWSSEGVAWIAARAGKIVNVQKELEEAFRGVLRKKEPKLAADVSIYFSEPVIPREGVLVVNAGGTIPKEQDTEAYQLKFKITGSGERVHFHLLKERTMEESFSTFGDDPEGELNKVYGQLRAKLPEARRALLLNEQRKWLKLREEMTDDGCKESFTEHRVIELRVRFQEEEGR
jgi:hypothetical protein